MGNRAISQELIDLVNRIRNRRQEVHLSQEALAEKVGISSNTVSRIEGGQTAMSVEIFRKLVQILGMNADMLLCSGAILPLEESERLRDISHRI